MIVGFTGTRNGMTTEQLETVEFYLKKLKPDSVVHGDCLGADYDFDELSAELGIERGIRPCTFENMRMHCETRGAKILAEPKRPMARNRDIVADADYLLACPPNKERIKSGSGTWATIGFGEKARIDVIVIYPDGSVGWARGER